MDSLLPIRLLKRQAGGGRSGGRWRSILVWALAVGPSLAPAARPGPGPDDLLAGWLSPALADPAANGLAAEAVGTAAALRHAVAAKANVYPPIEPAYLGTQRLVAGELRLEKTPCNLNYSFFMGGERCYEIGTLRGGFLRRGVLGGDEAGVWSQPFKLLDGVQLEIAVDGAPACRLDGAREVTNRLHAMEFVFRERGVRVTRRDFSPDEEYAFFWLFDFTNESDRPVTVAAELVLQANLRPIWHRPWTQAYGPDTIELAEGGVFVVRDPLIPGIEVACGAGPDGEFSTDTRNPYRNRGIVRRTFTLAPGETRTLDAGAAMFDRRKAPGSALATRHGSAAGYWRALLPQARARLAAKAAQVDRAVFGGVAFSCPDPKWQHAFYAAKYNLHSLRADLRPYLAGPHLMTCPERAYQHLFGIDPMYASAGAALAGFGDIARSTAGAHLHYAAQRGYAGIPFFVDHFGRHGDRGSRAQETTQFIATLWEQLKISGDRADAAAVYPQLRALLEAQEQRDRNGDGWIDGMTFPGLTRAVGTDTLGCAAVRLCAALRALAEMAAMLGRADEAQALHRRAEAWRARYEREWWDEAAGAWAAGLKVADDGAATRVLLGHFRYGSANYAQTYRVAGHAHGVRALHTVWRDAVDADGGFRGPAVTPWQNGNMALAAYRYGLPDYGFALLDRAADNPTRLEKMLGAFSTINSPVDRPAANDNKLMYCWGVGPFLEAIVTGLLGIEPDAFADTVIFRPQLPAAWPTAALRGFVFGTHTVDFVFADGAWTIRHRAGEAPLRVRTGRAAAALVIAPGDAATLPPPPFEFFHD